MREADQLPNDIEELKRLVLEKSAALDAQNTTLAAQNAALAELAAQRAELETAKAMLIAQTLELEKLRYEVARLKRMKFGRSSEQLDAQIAQMQLTLEDLEASLAGGGGPGAEGATCQAGAPAVAGAAATRGHHPSGSK
jgi:transposase